MTLRRSKTDQDGAGRKIGIPYGSNPETCPVRTVQAWIEQAALSWRPLFRSINRHGQVQRGPVSQASTWRASSRNWHVRAGLDPAKYAGHSLRAGHATGGGDCWGVGTVDHEADRAPERSDGSAVHSGWESVPGE